MGILFFLISSFSISSLFHHHNLDPFQISCIFDAQDRATDGILSTVWPRHFIWICGTIWRTSLSTLDFASPLLRMNCIQVFICNKSISQTKMEYSHCFIFHCQEGIVFKIEMCGENHSCVLTQTNRILCGLQEDRFYGWLVALMAVRPILDRSRWLLLLPSSLSVFCEYHWGTLSFLFLSWHRHKREWFTYQLLTFWKWPTGNVW